MSKYFTKAVPQAFTGPMIVTSPTNTVGNILTSGVPLEMC